MERYVTPPEYAKRLGVAPAKVLGWIRSGRLRALNVSSGMRARYVLKPDAIRDFESAIETEPPPPRPRRRVNVPVKEYFP